MVYLVMFQTQVEADALVPGLNTDQGIYGQDSILKAFSLNNLVFHEYYFCNFCSKNVHFKHMFMLQDVTGKNINKRVQIRNKM